MSKVSLRNTNRSLNSVSSVQTSPSNSLRRAGGVESFVKTRGGVSGGGSAGPTNPGYASPTPSGKLAMPPPPKMQALYNGGQKNYEDMKVPIPETYEEEWDGGKSEDGALKQPGRFQSDGFPERLAREWGNGNGNGTSFPDETFPGLSDTESSLYRLRPKSPERNTQYNYDDYSSEADQQTQLDYDASDVQYIDSEVGAKLPYHQSSPPRVPLMPEPPYHSREDEYNSDSSVDINDVDAKVQNTQKRLSMERQQLQRAAATSVPAVGVAKAVNIQRAYSNRSAKGKQPEVAIRERSPEDRRDSITPLSPDRRSVISVGLQRKRSYSTLKEVDFTQFTTQEWHQTTDSEPGRRVKSQPPSAGRYRSPNDVYGPPPSNMTPKTHKENQITYFANLPKQQYYDESTNIMKQLQDILQETRDAREAFITGTRQLEREIEERSRQVKKRRVELGGYLGGVKERLGRITGA